MKILHFIYDSIDNPWLGGGGAFRTHAIYDHFKDCDITVYSANYPEAHSKIPYQKFIGRPLKNYLLSRIEFSRCSRKFIKENHHNYDLIIEDFSPFSPIFASNIAPSKKVLLILQNYFGLSNHFTKFGPLGYLTNYFETKSIQSHKNILFSSEDLKTQVFENINSQIEKFDIIPYGVDEELFSLDIPVKEKYFSFFGRLEIHQKGLDVLLDAFEYICINFPEFKLKIAGKGKDESKFKQMIKKRGLGGKIDFLGFIQGQEKIDFLSQAKALLMPSTFESWGISSLESQACKTPVIGSNIPGLRQTINHGQSGFLYESFDEMKHYIEWVIQLSELEYSNLCNGAYENAKQFRWKPSADKQRLFYQKIR